MADTVQYGYMRVQHGYMRVQHCYMSVHHGYIAVKQFDMAVLHCLVDGKGSGENNATTFACACTKFVFRHFAWTNKLFLGEMT